MLNNVVENLKKKFFETFKSLINYKKKIKRYICNKNVEKSSFLFNVYKIPKSFNRIKTLFLVFHVS